MTVKVAGVDVPHKAHQVTGAARALLERHPLQRMQSPSRGASATAHGLPLISLAYSYYYLNAFPSPVNESFGWHLQYLTIIGLTLTLITFTVGFLADLTLSRKLFALKNGLSVASAPLECLITILYWSIRAIDPKLLEQSWADPMPLVVDMTFHLFPSLALIIDLLFFSPPYTIAFLPALGLSGGIACSYWIWIEECYKHNNFYPYPMFELLSQTQRAMLFAGSALTMALATGMLIWLYKVVNPPPPKRGTGNIEFARSGNVKGEHQTFTIHINDYKDGCTPVLASPSASQRWHSTSNQPHCVPTLTAQLATFAASCCGAATCSAVCSACGKCQNSVATRIAYALILLVNSLISWILLTDWAVKRLQKILLDYVVINCAGKECFGYAAVHRVNFALGLFHVILAVMLLGVNNSRDKRAPIQNGFWGPKLVAWLGLIVVSFFIPNRFFEIWGGYVALVGAILFLLLGLILLVDLAHTWAEYCVEKIEDTDSNLWRTLLIGSTLGMYIGSIAMTIVMYIFFANSGCSMNQAAITINLIFLLGISAMSIHPTIQASNPRAGLAQAATVSVYCTYLTLSAVAMEPDDRYCNPLVRASGTRKATIVLGAVVTFITCAYTTTRAATYGLALGSTRSTGYLTVGDDDGHGMVSTQPESRRAMRQEALRRAVESGALPASAMDDSDDDDDDEPKHKNDDEKNGTQYNYALFHIIFLLATAWIATLLTQNVGADRDISHAGEDFIPVGRSYWASWVKIVSAWVCYGIFGWTLAAPVILPDRFDF